MAHRQVVAPRLQHAVHAAAAVESDDRGTPRFACVLRPEQQRGDANRFPRMRIAVERIEDHSFRMQSARRRPHETRALRRRERRPVGRARIPNRTTARRRSHRRRDGESTPAPAVRDRSPLRFGPCSNIPIARHAASFSANGRVYAGDDDGSMRASRSRPRATRARARAAVLPLKQTSASAGAARRARADLAALGVADRAVEAAAALARDDRVPQSDAVRAQRAEPLAIRQLRQRLAEHRRDDRPEVVARMRVVLRARRARPRRESCRGSARACRARAPAAVRAATRVGLGLRGSHGAVPRADRARGFQRGTVRVPCGHAAQRTAKSSATPANTAKPSQWLCRNAVKQRVAVAAADQPPVPQRAPARPGEAGVVERPQLALEPDHDHSREVDRRSRASPRRRRSARRRSPRCAGRACTSSSRSTIAYSVS